MASVLVHGDSITDLVVKTKVGFAFVFCRPANDPALGSILGRFSILWLKQDLSHHAIGFVIDFVNRVLNEKERAFRVCYHDMADNFFAFVRDYAVILANTVTYVHP